MWRFGLSIFKYQGIAMSCKVRVQPSGHEFTVKGGESVLDAALRQGVILPYGCRNGTCGSCKGRIVAGHVTYETPTPALGADEQAAGLALFCQARPQGDLSIEVRAVPFSPPAPCRTSR